MESVRTSETSVPSNVTTRRYNPEDSTLQTRLHGNLKSHNCLLVGTEYPILVFCCLQRVCFILMILGCMHSSSCFTYSSLVIKKCLTQVTVLQELLNTNVTVV
jgi:hypothetical protein